MPCSVCKSALAEGDKHFGCIRHRQCSRAAPCSLDVNEPPAYWDEVEDLLKAINAVSPERRTSRRVSAKSTADQVDGGSGAQLANVNPPPLAPISNDKPGVFKHPGKKVKKVISKKTKHQTQPKKSSSVSGDSNDHSRPSPPRGSARGAEQDRGLGRPDLPNDPRTGSGEESGNFGPINCTSQGGSSGRVVSGGKGKYGVSSVVPSISVSEPIDRSTTSAEMVSMSPIASVTDQGSVANVGDSRQQSGFSVDSRHVPVLSGNVRDSGDPNGGRRPNGGDQGRSAISGDSEETEPSRAGPDRFPAVVGSVPEPDFRLPEVPVSGNRFSSDNRYPAVVGHGDSRVPATSDVGHSGIASSTSTLNGNQQRALGLSPFAFPQSNFTMFPDSFGLSASGQPAPIPSHYGGMLGQWTQPWGLGNGWCPFPAPSMPPPLVQQQHLQLSAPSVVTSQPVSSVIQSQPSSTVTWSVPSRRGSGSAGAAASGAARPPVRSVPSRELTSRQLEQSEDSDEDEDEPSEVSDDDESSALGNEADLFREIEHSDTGTLDPSQQDLDHDAQDERDKKIFSKDRVDPILLSAAQLAGTEFLEDTVSKSTLLFGHSGLKRKRPSPILSMPPDVYEFRDQARSFSGSLGKTSALTSVFRVPEEDFKGLFRVPDLGSDVETFLKKTPGTQTGYIRSWENALKGIDRELRSLSRLASFQLLITNAMAIHLSDTENGAEKDSPFAMAKLSADMAARQTTMLMRLSAHTVRLRRDNVFASILGHHKSKLVDKLKSMDLQDASLFGDGGFAATIKSVAKRVTDEHTLDGQLRATGVDSGAGTRSGKGGKARSRTKSRFHPYANTESRGQRRDRSNQSSLSLRSQGSSTGKSSSRGGRKQGRSGRGRGKQSNKRF